MHHVQPPGQSPAGVTRAVGAAGMHCQAGERAARTGLSSANHKKTLEGFWNEGQLHSQAQTSGCYGVAFCYRGPEHHSLSWEAAEQDSAPSLFKNKHKVFTATIASCMRNASSVSPQKCHAEG